MEGIQRSIIGSAVVCVEAEDVGRGFGGRCGAVVQPGLSSCVVEAHISIEILLSWDGL
jgi:hypothetical protein